MGKDKGSRVFFELYRKQKKEEELSAEQKQHSTTEGALEDNVKHADPNVKTEEPSKQQDLSSVQKTKIGSTIYGQEAMDLKFDLSPQTAPVLQKPEARKTLLQRLGLKRGNKVSIRQDTLIYATLGAVFLFLSLGCFFIGHKFGYNKGRKAEPIIAESVKQTSVRSTKELKASSGDLVVMQPTTEKPQRLLEVVPATASQTTQGIQSPPVVSEWSLQIISYKVGDKNTKKAVKLARTIQRQMGYDAFVAKTSRELVVCVGTFDSRDSSELLALQKKLRDFEYENKKQFKSCYPIRLR